MFRTSCSLCSKLRPRGRVLVASAYQKPLYTSTRLITDSKSNEVEEKKTNRVKEIFDKYGYVAIGTYLGVYVATLSGVFLALDYDLLASSSFGFDPITTTKSVSLRHICFLYL
jgi:hypothetical protein